jgi:Skp family chaperone for outer membrane proteins
MAANRYYGSGGGIPDGDSEGYKEKPRSRRKQNWMLNLLGKLKEPWTWPILLCLILITVTMRMKSQQSRFLQEVRASSFQDVIDTIQRSNREKESLRSDLRGMRESYYKANDGSIKLEREKRKLQQELDKLKEERPEQKAEQERYKSREEAWKSQVQLLQKATSRESRRAVMER